MLALFYGPDEFSCNEAIAEIRNRMPPDVVAMNMVRLDGRKLSLNDLAAACEAFPFLADRRLVIVADALKHTKAGKERESLRDYLAKVPPTCDLIFVESGDVDKRSTLFTYLRKHGNVQEFQPREGAELIRWLNERAAHEQTKLPKATAQRLVEYVGNESRMLLTELRKLATYAGRGNPITPDMVDLLVHDQQEQNLFAFLDDLSRRERKKALLGVRALLQEGQAAPYILFMLARQTRILLSVQNLAAQRMRADEIASTLKQKPFVVRKALEQVQNFRPGELEQLHEQLVIMDHAIKIGRIQAPVALDLLVLEMCGSDATVS